MSVSSSSSGAEKKSDSNWFGLDVKLAEVFEKEVRSPVRQQVSETREDISRWWSNSGFASFSKAVSDLPSRPPQLLQEGKERVLQRSQEMHNNYPYLASLCRSHETLLLGTTALLVGIPAKRK